MNIGRNFFICGLTGWCMEILFTSAGSLLRRDGRLIGQTSVWMFPIYGMAACIRPVYRVIRGLPALLRGAVYSVGIFSCEYLTGTLLKKHHMCPWDYSGAKANIDGVIRLDYAPFWMAAGLLFERILMRSDPQK
ncbi:MAG: putative ABC transporter permease [Roseburia sp.]